MLGKRNHRARAFSICHATVLAGFIVLSQVLGMGASDHELRLSGSETVGPLERTGIHRCSSAYDTGHSFEPCGFVIKAAQGRTGTVGVVIWRFGVRL
jgi:hypothetical protein